MKHDFVSARLHQHRVYFISVRGWDDLQVCVAVVVCLGVLTVCFLSVTQFLCVYWNKSAGCSQTTWKPSQTQTFLYYLESLWSLEDYPAVALLSSLSLRSETSLSDAALADGQLNTKCCRKGSLRGSGGSTPANWLIHEYINELQMKSSSGIIK